MVGESSELALYKEGRPTQANVSEWFGEGACTWEALNAEACVAKLDTCAGKRNRTVMTGTCGQPIGLWHHGAAKMR